MYLIIEEMSKYGYATTSHHVLNDKLRELDVYSLAPPVAMGPNKNPTRVYVVHKPNLLPPPHKALTVTIIFFHINHIQLALVFFTTQ